MRRAHRVAGLALLAAALCAAASCAFAVHRSCGSEARGSAARLRAAANSDVPLPESTKPKGPPPFNPAKQLGVMDPTGFFDPAGFSKDEQSFRQYRTAELKHGRVAMMAAFGSIFQHWFRLPGFDYDNVPNGIGALFKAPGTYGFIVLVLLSGALELTIWSQDKDKDPGDFGDPLNLQKFSPSDLDDMREREISNGRMGMISIAGIIGGELASGLDGVEQLIP